VPNPYAALKQLINIQVKYILLNRLGVTRGDHTVAYPFVFPQESVMRGMIQETHREIACFADSSGIFPVRDEPIIGIGLLAARRAN
jgi:hypothetical protein